MRLVFVVAATLACATAVEVVRPGGYHADVGIPLAAKIKDAEEKSMAKRIAFDNAFGERIIGGVLAPAMSHPYFAGLLIDLLHHPGQSVCGASLLSFNRLVTAAHCWFDGINQAWRFNVVLGTQYLYWGGQRVQTSSVFMHPVWTPHNLLNDIAMIHLPINVQFTPSIQPVRIADEANTFNREWATAVGFGKTSDSQATASTVLSHVNLQVISEAECRAIYGEAFIFPSTLCTSGTGGVGVCEGDSGGPLVLQRQGQPILIGVSSFAAQGMCELGFPSGFARVTSFISFIRQHLPFNYEFAKI